jgi:hypothetical protein
LWDAPRRLRLRTGFAQRRPAGSAAAAGDRGLGRVEVEHYATADAAKRYAASSIEGMALVSMENTPTICRRGL